MTSPSPSPVSPTKTSTDRPKLGDRVRFDGKATSWLVQGVTKSRRYILVTASIFGVDHWKIIDWDRDVVGSAEARSAKDPELDEAYLILHRLRYDEAYAPRPSLPRLPLKAGTVHREITLIRRADPNG